METGNKQQEKKAESNQMKNKSFIIKGTVYPFDIYVFVGDDLKKCHKFIKSIVPKEVRKDILKRFDNTYRAYTLQAVNGSVIIHYTVIPDIGLLCHEAFHACEFILEHVCIVHTPETSEAYAYFLHYLTEELYKNIHNELS